MDIPFSLRLQIEQVNRPASVQELSEMSVRTTLSHTPTHLTHSIWLFSDNHELKPLFLKLYQVDDSRRRSSLPSSSPLSEILGVEAPTEDLSLSLVIDYTLFGAAFIPQRPPEADAFPIEVKYLAENGEKTASCLLTLVDTVGKVKAKISSLGLEEDEIELKRPNGEAANASGESGNSGVNLADEVLLNEAFGLDVPPLHTATLEATKKVPRFPIRLFPIGDERKAVNTSIYASTTVCELRDEVAEVFGKNSHQLNLFFRAHCFSKSTSPPSQQKLSELFSFADYSSHAPYSIGFKEAGVTAETVTETAAAAPLEAGGSGGEQNHVGPEVTFYELEVNGTIVQLSSDECRIDGTSVILSPAAVGKVNAYFDVNVSIPGPTEVQDMEAERGNEQAEGGNEQPESGNAQAESGNEETESGNEQAQSGNEQAQSGIEQPERGNEQAGRGNEQAQSPVEPTESPVEAQSAAHQNAAQHVSDQTHTEDSFPDSEQLRQNASTATQTQEFDTAASGETQNSEPNENIANSAARVELRSQIPNPIQIQEAQNVAVPGSAPFQQPAQSLQPDAQPAPNQELHGVFQTSVNILVQNRAPIFRSLAQLLFAMFLMIGESIVILVKPSILGPLLFLVVGVAYFSFGEDISSWIHSNILEQSTPNTVGYNAVRLVADGFRMAHQLNSVIVGFINNTYLAMLLRLHTPRLLVLEHRVFGSSAEFAVKNMLRESCSCILMSSATILPALEHSTAEFRNKLMHDDEAELTRLTSGYLKRLDDGDEAVRRSVQEHLPVPIDTAVSGSVREKLMLYLTLVWVVRLGRRLDEMPTLDRVRI